VNGHSIVGRVIPNVFFRCIDSVCTAMEELRPSVVVMLGEYGGRAAISVERIAQNLNDSKRYGLVDNDGCSFQDQPTVPGGPVAYLITLPTRAMVKQMRKAGVPSEISDAPGTFCCNHLMYGVLHHIAINGIEVRAGWIHLPFLPSTAPMEENLGAPSMSRETSAQGGLVAIRAIIQNPVDIKDAVSSRLQI